MKVWTAMGSTTGLAAASVANGAPFDIQAAANLVASLSTSLPYSAIVVPWRCRRARSSASTAMGVNWMANLAFRAIFVLGNCIFVGSI
uniref:Uncharacterized protein n=1 Tax=Anopheles darlingi TaxID=43151 RepID=A0A2M4DHY9_ANODA